MSDKQNNPTKKDLATKEDIRDFIERAVAKQIDAKWEELASEYQMALKFYNKLKDLPEFSVLLTEILLEDSTTNSISPPQIGNEEKTGDNNKVIGNKGKGGGANAKKDLAKKENIKKTPSNPVKQTATKINRANTESSLTGGEKLKSSVIKITEKSGPTPTPSRKEVSTPVQEASTEITQNEEIVENEQCIEDRREEIVIEKELKEDQTQAVITGEATKDNIIMKLEEEKADLESIEKEEPETISTKTPTVTNPKSSRNPIIPQLKTAPIKDTGKTTTNIRKIVTPRNTRTKRAVTEKPTIDKKGDNSKLVKGKDKLNKIDKIDKIDKINKNDKLDIKEKPKIIAKANTIEIIEKTEIINNIDKTEENIDDTDIIIERGETKETKNIINTSEETANTLTIAEDKEENHIGEIKPLEKSKLNTRSQIKTNEGNIKITEKSKILPKTRATKDKTVKVEKDKSIKPINKNSKLGDKKTKNVRVSDKEEKKDIEIVGPDEVIERKIKPEISNEKFGLKNEEEKEKVADNLLPKEPEKEVINEDKSESEDVKIPITPPITEPPNTKEEKKPDNPPKSNSKPTNPIHTAKTKKAVDTKLAAKVEKSTPKPKQSPKIIKEKPNKKDTEKTKENPNQIKVDENKNMKEKQKEENKKPRRVGGPIKGGSRKTKLLEGDSKLSSKTTNKNEKLNIPTKVENNKEDELKLSASQEMSIILEENYVETKSTQDPIENESSKPIPESSIKPNKIGNNISMDQIDIIIKDRDLELIANANKNIKNIEGERFQIKELKENFPVGGSLEELDQWNQMKENELMLNTNINVNHINNKTAARGEGEVEKSKEIGLKQVLEMLEDDIEMQEQLENSGLNVDEFSTYVGEAEYALELMDGEIKILQEVATGSATIALDPAVIQTVEYLDEIEISEYLEEEPHRDVMWALQLLLVTLQKYELFKFSAIETWKITREYFLKNPKHNLFEQISECFREIHLTGKEAYYLQKLAFGKEDKICATHFQKLSTATGMFMFGIKEIIDTVSSVEWTLQSKQFLARLLRNRIYLFSDLEDKLSGENSN